MNNTLLPLQNLLQHNLLSFLVRVGLTKNVTNAANLVKLGLVLINGQVIYSVNYLVKEGDFIEIDYRDSILTKS